MTLAIVVPTPEYGKAAYWLPVNTNMTGPTTGRIFSRIN
jgi:hypothetical protein